MTTPSRGEFWLVDLNPQSYKEEPAKKGRPCLVIQTDPLNAAGHPTTIVIPGTSKVFRDALGDAFPLRVSVGRVLSEGELAKETDLLIDQVRAISNRRLVGTAPIGRASEGQLQRVQEALRMILGL